MGGREEHAACDEQRDVCLAYAWRIHAPLATGRSGRCDLGTRLYHPPLPLPPTAALSFPRVCGVRGVPSVYTLVLTVVGLVQPLDRLLPLVREDQRVPLRDQIVDRATRVRLAERGATVHAPRRLPLALEVVVAFYCVQLVPVLEAAENRVPHKREVVWSVEPTRGAMAISGRGGMGDTHTPRRSRGSWGHATRTGFEKGSNGGTHNAQHGGGDGTADSWGVMQWAKTQCTMRLGSRRRTRHGTVPNEAPSRRLCVTVSCQQLRRRARGGVVHCASSVRLP